MENPHRSKILKAMLNLSLRYSAWDIFFDFVELGALCITNSIEPKGSELWERREKQYMVTVNKYAPDEQKIFSEMFADLVKALEYELTWSNSPTDVLGVLFHELELHNKYKGQFFTPQNISDMMGQIAFSNKKDNFTDNGFISLNEPCCGSGAMILGFASAMLEGGINYCSKLFIRAGDIDLKCVYMCYLQLSLYGIPAVVVHENSLTLESWSRWHTPVYVFGGWALKLRNRNNQKSKEEGSKQHELKKPAP